MESVAQRMVRELPQKQPPPLTEIRETPQSVARDEPAQIQPTPAPAVPVAATVSSKSELPVRPSLFEFTGLTEEEFERAVRHERTVTAAQKAKLREFFDLTKWRVE